LPSAAPAGSYAAPPSFPSAGGFAGISPVLPPSKPPGIVPTMLASGLPAINHP
jgi:hypothetical protein